MTKFGCHVIVLAYFWYFKLIFIFRGPIYGLFELFTNIWQPWKWNLTSYYCSGSLKTHESEFYFSGLPNFDNQGCHISLGRNCTNSIPAQENGQITSLKHPTVGIHGKFCCTFFTLVSWTVWRSGLVRLVSISIPGKRRESLEFLYEFGQTTKLLVKTR